MEELLLNNRRVKLVDGEIYVWKPTKNPYWNRVKTTPDKDGYCIIGLYYDGKDKKYKYHRIVYKFHNRNWDITDVSSNNEIDHFDNNKSNNDIKNLRVVNRSENKQNTISTKGYYFNKAKNKYQAQITINNKVIYLGSFETEDEARNCYLDAKNKLHIKCYTIF